MHLLSSQASVREVSVQERASQLRWCVLYRRCKRILSRNHEPYAQVNCLSVVLADPAILCHRLTIYVHVRPASTVCNTAMDPQILSSCKVVHVVSMRLY